MNKVIARIIKMLLLVLSCHSAVADVVLSGQMDIGDNSYYLNNGWYNYYQYTVLSPSVLITKDNQPVEPMHFTLTQNSTITQVLLNNDAGILFGVNFVIWNSSGQVVVNQTASNAQPDRIAGSWFLAAGDYRLAIWGRCTNKHNGNVTGNAPCFQNNTQHEWDDISFSGVTLVGATSTASNFIQRQHVGDSYEASGQDRWYPDYPTGVSATYSLDFSQDSTISQLVMYHFRDWNMGNVSRVQIRPKGSNTILWQHVFTQADNNTDLVLQPGISVTAGDYEVVVSTNRLSDDEDLSWDDIVVTATPAPDSLAYQCATVFPYPLQGRSDTDYVNLASNSYGYLAARVWGGQGGKLGYRYSSQILNPGSSRNGNVIVDGNCDNQLCVADQLAGSISLPASVFPLAGGTSFTLNYNQSRTLTNADGYNFGSITTNYQSTLIFSVPGVKIKNLTIGSDLPGKAYTVKLAAGEYWIENLTMGDSASIVLDGDVILHVKNMSMNSANLLNSAAVKQSGTVSKLLLVIYDALYLGNRSTVSGLVYQTDSASGAITLSSAAYIYGRVNAHNIQFGDGSVVDSSGYRCSDTPPAINHYEIRYPASQITCEPAAVTINACTNSDTSSCTPDTAVTSSVSLSAPATGWSSNPVTLTNGTATASLSHYAAGNVTLGLGGTTAYTCFKNGVIDSSCQLPFVDTSLSFDIPTFYAGSNSGDVTLKAIQSVASGNTAVCKALLTGEQTISFSRQYLLPATGAISPTVNNTVISSNTSVPLTFDSNGMAILTLAYNDAGVLNITAQYTKTDVAAGTLSLSGTDNVAILPAEILLTPEDVTALCNGSDEMTYAGCNKYKIVGENFTVNAEAGFRSGNSWNKTSNFFTSQMSSLPVVQHQLLAPASGTLPALAATSLSFNSGSASVLLSERDVGVYQYGVTAFVPYSAYQNESPQKTVPLSWSRAIGRFVPKSLHASIASHGALTTDSCSAGFVNSALGYVGQELQFASLPAVAVTALGADGVTVMNNYQGAFAKITAATPSASGTFAANLIPKNNVNNLSSVATWATGSWSTLMNAYQLLYSFGDDRFTFTKTNANQVAPFETSLTISALADSDGVSAASLPLDLLPVAPDASAFNIYTGRLTLESVNGAEHNALALPFYMQYWNGSAYAMNSADNCTTLASTDLLMNNQAGWAGIPLRIASATNSVATTTAALAPAKVSSGVGAISFTAPDAAGWVDIAATASLPDWMKDFTLPSGLTPARASFGYYRGNDRLIYRREVFGGQ